MGDVVFSGRSKMSGSGSMPTRPVPAPQRGRKPSQALQIINCRMFHRCFKTQFDNVKSRLTSSENVAPTRKR